MLCMMNSKVYAYYISGVLFYTLNISYAYHC